MHSRHERKKTWQIATLALPAVLFVFVFSYIPMFGIIVAFKNINFIQGIFRSPWIGFGNFEFLFKSKDVLLFTRNTLVYNSIIIVLGMIVALALALLLNEVRAVYAVKVYQTVFFFPYFFSWVVVAYAVYSYFSPIGILTTALNGIGIDITNWYLNINYWPPFLIMMAIWKNAGYNCVIYYASIMGISGEYYEAAHIDGANRIQCIRYITIPLLSPMITMLLILGIGGVFYSDFGMFFFLPRNSAALLPVTQTIDTAVFRMLTGSTNIGQTAAVGLFQSLMGFLLVLATNIIVKRRHSENAIF